MFSCSMKGWVDEKGKCCVVCVKRESALSRFCAVVARNESMSDVLSVRKSAYGKPVNHLQNLLQDR